MKIKLNMIGGGFQHDICSSALNTPKNVIWTKDKSSSISIHIDNSILLPVDPSKLNFGWFAESSAIIPNVIEKVKTSIDEYKFKFKYIFTHDQRIIDLDPSFFKFTYPNALPWVQNKKIFKKTKKISSITSNKLVTQGHIFRNKVINNFDNSVIEKFGRGTPNELPWTIRENGLDESGKIVALKDFEYSFAFENDNYEHIFCEKITDCFATGTIPIYWGTPSIGNFFNINGIIKYDENFKLENLTSDLYETKKPYVLENFEKIIDLPTAEDYIYLNYLK